jgi:hypothetical protein
MSVVAKGIHETKKHVTVQNLGSLVPYFSDSYEMTICYHCSLTIFDVRTWTPSPHPYFQMTLFLTPA